MQTYITHVRHFTSSSFLSKAAIVVYIPSQQRGAGPVSAVALPSVCDEVADVNACFFSFLDADGKHHENACTNTSNDCCAYQGSSMGQQHESKRAQAEQGFVQQGQAVMVAQPVGAQLASMPLKQTP